MKDKTKRTGLIVLGSLACIALVVVIAGQFGGRNTADPAPETPASSETTPQVTVETKTPNAQISESTASETSAPGTGADSEGTEQTIQADPVKPETPEKLTSVPDDHTAEDVPEEERNAETPPAYTEQQTSVTEPSAPDAGSTNTNGQVYVPGFGYVDNEGGNQAVEDNSIYENGNKIGSMG